MKNLMMTIVGAVSAMVATADTIYVTTVNFESCRTLQNGNTYLFTENIDYAASACQSAMTVAEGANVVIVIAKGVVVSLTGGAANGMTGAGAGIEVPEGAKLIVAGAGELFATGGNAANGADGGVGKAAEITDESYWYTTSGFGGAGGNGGGGAGAGIGGKGGAGGMGGAGAAGVTDNWFGNYLQSGAAGGAGGAGGQGKGCGTIEVGGTVTITAKGGGAAAKGGYGGAYSGREIAEGSTWYGAGYGGGGGGGGGGGVAASDIGGGGGGGGAGGGGGSGGICYFDDVDTVLMCKLNGDGGNGGKGVVGDVGLLNDYSGGFFTLFKENQIWPGEETSAKINTVPYSTYTPGAGGVGGEAGAKGGDGSLTVSTSAKVNGASGEIQDPTINGVSIWACAGDGWTFDPASGKVTIEKNRAYALAGDVTFANARVVTLAGLKPGVTLTVSGLPDITSLTTDGAGMVTGLCLVAGNYNFTLGDAVFSFAVGGSPTEFAAAPSASFILGEHIASVSYTTEPDVAHGTARDGFKLTGLPQGTKITLSADCGAEYDYLGLEEFSVGAGDLYVAMDAVPKVEYCDDQGNVFKAAHVTDFGLCTATDNIVGDGKWYVVRGTVERDAITVSGSANLILADGASLTVKGARDHAGIGVLSGNSLTIWGQTNGTGELTATGGLYGAGIGSYNLYGGDCGTVTINGGTVKATGGKYGAGIGGGYQRYGGTVTINGGTVTATGGEDGSGIGGYYKYRDSGTVTINGGVVTTTGGDGGAGIGGTVTINGGEVTATGGKYDAGIGATVTINGGEVTATGGKYGAGIGGGYVFDGGEVTINGGTVMATGGESGAGIGSGYDGSGVTVRIDGGSVKASSIQDVRGCPTNGKGANVYCVTVPGVTMPSVTVSSVVTGLEGYGTNGIVPIDDKLYLYLPNRDGRYLFSVDGVTYHAVVSGGATTAMPYRTVSFTLDDHIQSVSYTTNPDVAHGTATDSFMLTGPQGTVITLTNVCVEDGYDYLGKTTYTVGATDMSIDLPAAPLKTASFTLDEHILSVTYSTNPYVTNGTATDDFTLTGLPQGTVITLDKIVCEEGYAYYRETKQTVGAKDMNVLLKADRISFASVEYCDAEGKTQTVENVELIHPNTVAIGGGKWYAVDGEMTMGTITVSGEVNLILLDGAKLTVNGGLDRAGIAVTNGNSLTIWGQTKGTGELTATGGDGGAGIGGNKGASLFDSSIGTFVYVGGDGGTVTVNGGTVTATGGKYGAGIGGGQIGTGGTVTINGGTVTATGGSNAAGIGGGQNGAGGTVTINGGMVTVTGGEFGAGIGGGDQCSGGDLVTINGGTVTVTGGDGGAGIGGGQNGAGGTVTINGGTVTATGGDGGAGIGGGWDHAGGTVKINGGTVTATGGKYGAGIGGGEGRAGGTVTIDGGSIKASSVQSQPKNGDGENVYRMTVGGCGASCEITGLQGYGLKDVVPIDGMLYFYLPNDEYSFMVNDFLVKATVNGRSVAAQVTYNGSVTIFDDGLCYLESSNGAFIDTGYKPTTSTRIVADMNPLAKTGSWLVFFGVTSGDNSKDGILLRYSDSDDINGWFCGDNGLQAKIGGLQNTRITAELKSGGMTLNGETSEITTTGTPYDGPIYLFCGNNGSSAWRHQQMRFYSFKIYDTVDGVANQLVRDLVPAQATEHPAIVGLYDRVTKLLYVNCGSGSFALGCDAQCEGGEIAKGDGGVWVVTPTNGATTVTITGLPDGDTVAVPPTVTQVNGVADAQIRVRSGAYDITGAFAITGGAIALDENGVVMIGDETIPVRPIIGDLGDEDGEPFVVGDTVAVTVRTIPGLKYELWRGERIGSGGIIDPALSTGPVVATGTRVTLTDDEPPAAAGAAFYRVAVGK